MNKESLKVYLSSRYQGWNSFLNNVIFPIFGEDDFEDGYEAELLESQPERRQLAEATGIRSIKQVGMMYVGVEPLQIFDVTVSDRVMMERNRVNIQRLIRTVMDQFSCAFIGALPIVARVETRRKQQIASVIPSSLVLVNPAVLQRKTLIVYTIKGTHLRSKTLRMLSMLKPCRKSSLANTKLNMKPLSITWLTQLMGCAKISLIQTLTIWECLLKKSVIVKKSPYVTM